MSKLKICFLGILIGISMFDIMQAAEEKEAAAQEEQKATADFESQAEALAQWFRTEREKLRQENPEMVEFQGQTGGLKEFGKIVKGYGLSSGWEPFEGESKILNQGVQYDLLKMSPNRRFLFAGFYINDEIDVWDMHFGYEKIKTLDGKISTITFSPDGHSMALGQHGHAKGIALWDMRDFQKKPQFFPGDVDFPQISPNGRYLMGTSNRSDHTLVWDLHNPAAGPETFSHFSFSPGGRYKIIRKQQGDAIHVLDMQNPDEAPQALAQDVDDVYFSPQDRYMVLKSSTHTKLKDMQDERNYTEFLRKNLELDFSPKENYVILGIVNRSEPEPISKQVWNMHKFFTPHAHPVTGILLLENVIFSANDRYIFLGNSSRTDRNRLLDMQNSHKNKVIKIFNNPEDTAIFSFNNNYLVTNYLRTHPRKITLWDMKNPNIEDLITLDGDIHNTYFSLDDQYLVTLSPEIKIIDVFKIQERVNKERLEAEQKRARLDAEQKEQEQKRLEEEQQAQDEKERAASAKEQEKREQQQHLDAVLQESIRMEEERQANVNRQFSEFMANMPPGPAGESFSELLERFNEYVLQQAVPKEE